jgi:predicted NACHT family NTPase
MAVTRFVSEEGLKIFEQARIANGLNKTVGGKESPWFKLGIGKSTLDRFRKRKAIKHENFIAICKAAGIDDWEKIADRSEIIQTKSNLSIDRSTSTELDVFSQQIFDWFKSLGFQSEGSPKPEGNYVEWVIQVPVRRSRFDRVLIRATIHEAGLSDLDSLRRGVAQLRMDEGWLVTNLWVNQSVRQALNKSDDDRNLDCLTFDELIDRDADFTPYLDWLEREISKREIDRYYVDLGCTKGEFDADTRTLRGTSKYSVADGGIDRYIDRWLENPVTEHVSILGEFGTGKTWFAFHYAGKCLQAYREAKLKGRARPRLPLVIPLRDTRDVKNVLAGFFFKEHNIRFTSDVFDRLNQMGKLLLIFDGFDEMADKNDPQKVADHFWELAKVVTTNAKVILTCRTEHFPTAQDGRENFGGERIPSNTNKIAVAPKFETLELMKFDDEQIRAVLSRRTNLATVELVMTNSQLLDLLRRAVMAEFVLEALPEIEAGKPIDLARVYLYAVRHKMERDITTGRTFTSLADKLYFLCELAWEMLSEDKMSLNYREFPERLRVLFKNEVKEQKHLDHWHYDMMGQTMLIRNDDGDYSPAHRSLLEFFVAYKLAAELGLLADDFLEMAQNQSGIDESLDPEFYTWSSYWNRELDDKGERKLIAPLAGFEREPLEKLRDTFGKSSLTKAILDLLVPAINLNVKYREPNLLLDLIKSTKAAEVGYLGGNAATVLVKKNPFALDYQDLSSTNLANSDLVNAGLRGTMLSGTNLENCLVTRVFGSISTIIMSKDDRYLITAHDDSMIRIWDRNSGIERQKLTGHHENVNCLVLSANGEFLYSGSNDSKIKEWRLVDGICQRTFAGYQDSINCLTLSIDEQFLYSGSNDRTIVQWELATGNYHRTFEGHEGAVSAIALNADGQFLYSGSYDRTIKKWGLADGVCLQTLGDHKDPVSDIALSADGQFLYSGSHDWTIKKWGLADGHGLCQQTFQGHDSWVRAIVLSEDGQFLYSSSSDWTIKEWKLADGLCQRTFQGQKDWMMRSLVLSRNGKFLFSGGNSIIKEWTLIDGICQRTFQGYQNLVSSIALSADGKLLYSGNEDGTIKEWRIADSTCQRIFHGHELVVMGIALSADGQFLYSSSNDQTIKEWKLANGICQRTFETHQNWLSGIALSENGQFLYLGIEDGTIQEWKLDDGTCQRTWKSHNSSVNVIALSKDGQFLYSGSSRGTTKEWKLVDGTCQRTFPGHHNLLRATALSADRQFRYYAKNDFTVKAWKLADNSLHRSFPGHQDLIAAISLSTDGKLLYSASQDETIKEWDVATGECLRTIDPRLCAGANITNVKGLTPAQTDALIALGAITDD